ncbi:hypothetical protein LTR94_029187, partial [Friedmanniomyces endolithicus]
MAGHDQRSPSLKALKIKFDPGRFGSALSGDFEYPLIAIRESREICRHRCDRGCGLVHRRKDGFGAIGVEDSANAQFGWIGAVHQQATEPCLGKAKAVRSTILGQLRETQPYQGQVHPDPIERDKTERKFNGIRLIRRGK